MLGLEDDNLLSVTEYFMSSARVKRVVRASSCRGCQKRMVMAFRAFMPTFSLG